MTDVTSPIDLPDGGAASSAAAWRRVVDAHGAMLGHADLAHAAHALASALAGALAFDRVSIGLLHDDLMQVVAASGLADPAEAAADPAVAAAMLEAVDQRCAIVVPDAAPARVAQITFAHRALLRGPVGSILSVRIVANGEAIGAITAWRDGAAPVTSAEIDSLEYAGCLAGPVLSLMRANERSPWRRLRDTAERWWADGTARGPWFKPVAIGAGAAVALLALWPLQSSVGGRARLEGAVQRVLVAPADGFLKQAHARPGDLVRAGQPLIEFAQQDLQLDRARWASQLEQHENSLAGANAKRDRAQLVIHQARAAEAEAQLELAESRLERSVLEAPFDGIVVRGDLSQQMGAPVQLGAELMTLAPRDRFRVIVEVDERDIAAVRLGQRGSATLSALPWDTLALRVTRIAPMATAVEGSNVFEVEAELLERRPDMRPGLQGTAHIAIGHQPLLWRSARRVADAARLLTWRWFG